MKKLILICACISHLSLLGAAHQEKDYSEHNAQKFCLVLRRLINPDAQFYRGGTNNLVHFSCISNEGPGSCHGFLNAGGEHDFNDFPIPVDPQEMAILISVAKNRFSVFHKAEQSRKLIVREYEKGSHDIREDHELEVKNLPRTLQGACPVSLQVEHGGLFSCKTVIAAVGKKTASTPTLPIAIAQPAHEIFDKHSRSFDGPYDIGSPPPYAAPSAPVATPLQRHDSAPDRPWRY